MEYIKTTYHVGTMALQKTAAKVMTTNPVSLRDDATLAEAIASWRLASFAGRP